jgi:hypothetical protein
MMIYDYLYSTTTDSTAHVWFADATTMSQTNSSALETISEFDEHQLGPQGTGKNWTHEASMDYGTYETAKNFVSAMMESKSDHNSSDDSIASDDLMKVEPVHHYV